MAGYTFENALRWELCENPLYFPPGHNVAGLDGKSPLPSSEAANYAQHIGDVARRLLQSDHPDDTCAVNEIDHDFYVHDWPYQPPDLYGVGEYVLTWMAHSPDHAIAELLRWNVQRQQKHQDRLAQDIPQLQEGTLASIGKMIHRHGVMPEAAQALAEQAFNAVTYRALDSVTSGAWGASGLFNSDERILGLANSYVGGEDGFESLGVRAYDTHTHETIHAIGSAGNGSLRVIFPEADYQVTQLADEAWTQHCVRVGNTGRPESIRPSDLGSYQDERELLADLSELGKWPIGFEVWRDAFTEPLDADRQPARAELHRLLSEGFADLVPQFDGRNVLCALAANLSHLPEASQREEMQKFCRTLRARTGWIDLTDQIPSDARPLPW